VRPLGLTCRLALIAFRQRRQPRADPPSRFRRPVEAGARAAVRAITLSIRMRIAFVTSPKTRVARTLRCTIRTGSVAAESFGFSAA
jgi:hypothetical protein